MGDTPDKPEDEKPKGPKKITVTVLRAIDQYHHRGATLAVPNDAYHKSLIKQGNLRVED